MIEAERKKKGRQLSAMRNGLRESEDLFQRLIPILQNTEPDAAWIAEDGHQAARQALLRAENIERNG